MPPRAFVVRKPRPIDAEGALPRHRHRPGDGAEIDRVAAGARGLATDGAVAAHERYRLGRLDREFDLAAMARAFQMHRDLPFGARMRVYHVSSLSLIAHPEH